MERGTQSDALMAQWSSRNRLFQRNLAFQQDELVNKKPYQVGRAFFIPLNYRELDLISRVPRRRTVAIMSAIKPTVPKHIRDPLSCTHSFRV